MARHALKLAVWPAVISLVVAILRFTTERAGFPDSVTFWIGITWVAVVTGIYYGFKLAGLATSCGTLEMSQSMTSPTPMPLAASAP